MVISKKPLRFVTALLIALLPLFSFANPVNDSISTDSHQVENHDPAAAHNEHAHATDIKSQVDAFKKHHVLDSHDFTLYSDYEQGTHFGISLPIILWDNGLHVFSSARFHHGDEVAESNGSFYRLSHADGKIYKVDGKDGKIIMGEKFPINERPLNFSITKSVVFIFLTAFLMFYLFTSLAKSYKKNGNIASGVGRIFEPIVLYIRDDIAIPNIGEKHYRRYMSYLLSIFFFILFLNLFGLTPLGVNVTGNLTITFALAILTALITNFTANKNYWSHIFWMPGVPVFMKIVLAPIELLGVIIKPFSLMIRLYANIFAGHIVLMSIIGLIFIFRSWLGSSLSFGLSFLLSILEILVAFLQAYIFTMLSALYFGAASEEHHHEEAHH